MSVDTETIATPSPRRLALPVVIVAIGLAAIVGSGGGVGIPADFCSTCLGGGPVAPTVSVSPGRQDVQVGASVTFTASASFGTGGVPSVQWCRQERGAGSCADIPGATALSHTLSQSTWPTMAPRSS